MAASVRCMKCRSPMILDRYCNYDDGVVVRVYLCSACIYIHIDAEKHDERCNWHQMHHLI
jgi:hypothetical protein